MGKSCRVNRGKKIPQNENERLIEEGFKKKKVPSNAGQSGRTKTAGDEKCNARRQDPRRESGYRSTVVYLSRSKSNPLSGSGGSKAAKSAKRCVCRSNSTRARTHTSAMISLQRSTARLDLDAMHGRRNAVLLGQHTISPSDVRKLLPLSPLSLHFQSEWEMTRSKK